MEYLSLSRELGPVQLELALAVLERFEQVVELL